MRKDMTQERVKILVTILLSSWIFFIISCHANSDIIDTNNPDSNQYVPNKRINFSLSVDDLCFKKIPSIKINNDYYPLNKNLRYKRSLKIDFKNINKPLKNQGLKYIRMENMEPIPSPSSGLWGIENNKDSGDYYSSDNIDKAINIMKIHLKSVAESKKIVIKLSSKEQYNKKILSAFKRSKFYYRNRVKNTTYNKNTKHIISIPSVCNKQLQIRAKDFYEPSGQFELLADDSFDNTLALTAQSIKQTGKVKKVKKISKTKKAKEDNKAIKAIKAKKNKQIQKKAPAADKKPAPPIKEKVISKPDIQELEFIFSERPFLQTSLREKFLEPGTKITHISSGKELLVTANKKLIIKFSLDEKIGDKISINNPNYSIIDSKIERESYKTIINTVVRDKNDEILIVYYPLDPTTSYRSKISDDMAKLMNFEFSSFLSKFKDQYSKVYYRMREEGQLNEFKDKASLGQELLMSNDELRDNVEFNWSDTSIYNEIKQMNQSSQVFHIVYFTGKNEHDLVRIFQKAPNAHVYAIQFERNTQNIKDKNVNNFMHLHKINYHDVSSKSFNDIFNSEMIIKYFRGQQ